MRKNKQRDQIERERGLYEEFLQFPINSMWLKPACLFAFQTYLPPANKKRVRGKIQKMRKEYAQKIGAMLVARHPVAHYALNRDVLEVIALVFPKKPDGIEARNLLWAIHKVVI